MRQAIVLTDNDHAGNQHNISVNAPNLDTDEDDPAMVVLPEGFDVEDLKVKCLTCDCVLMRGEDFEIEEVEAWKA